MSIDWSQLDSGTAGNSVVLKSGQNWVGIKIHMVQEADDAEYDAFARELGSASRRQTLPERITDMIFKDALAAIWRVVLKDPGPGRQ
jgi:hypothetical protein